MEDQIDEEIKSVRQEKLMIIQKSVVENLNKLKISKVYDIFKYYPDGSDEFIKLSVFGY